MRAHVIGNGKSYIYFKKIEESDYVLGCNKPLLDVDATIIQDQRFFRSLTDKFDPIVIDVPMIINNKCVKWLDSKLGKLAKDKLNIKEVYEYDTRYYPCSSAHVACLYLIDNGYSEIHIWGCDSLENYTMISMTDQFVDPAYTAYKDTDMSHVNQVVNGWRNKWKMIMENNQTVDIVFNNKANICF